MATFGETFDALSADQKNVIREEIKRREDLVKDKTRDESEQALRIAKEEFKSAVQSVRRPEIYTSAKDIRLYMNTFESYIKSIKLNEASAKQSFLTYLDPESFQKIKVLEILGINDWEAFKDAVVVALSPAMSKMAIKQKLRTIKQRQGETVSEFYDRIIVLASQYFGDDVSDAEKSTLLKETLAAGLSDDQISVEIIEQDQWNFKESLDYAVRREQSMLARKEITGDDKEHLTILNVAGPSGDMGQNGSTRQGAFQQGEMTPNKPTFLLDVRCHNCNELGHMFRECPIPQTCFHCHKPGHRKSECYALQNATNRQGLHPSRRANEGQNGSTGSTGYNVGRFRQEYRNQNYNRENSQYYGNTRSGASQARQERDTFRGSSQNMRGNNNRGYQNPMRNGTFFDNQNREKNAAPMSKNGHTPLK